MPAYAQGNKAWGLCQRCGLRFLYRELIFDGYFPNLRVCEGCYDAPQPQEKLAIVSDPAALWKPSPDAYTVFPPYLTATISASHVVLKWTSIGQDAVGTNKQGAQSAVLSKGYTVYRSSDGITYAPLITLLNTADEFGALSIETLTYTDLTPPVGLIYYYVRGFDVLESAEYG